MALELLPCHTFHPIPILSPFPSRCQGSQSQFLVYTLYFFFFLVPWADSCKFSYVPFFLTWKLNIFGPLRYFAFLKHCLRNHFMPFVAIFLSLLSHPLCASACFLCWWLWATLRRVVCASVASAPHAGQWWSACLGRKGGLEKETATCSSVLPWKTHGEEPMGSKESDTAEWLSAHAYVVPCCCRQYSWKCSIVGFCGCTSSMWVQSKLNIFEVLYILLFTNVLWSLQKPLNKGLARSCILVQYCCSAFLGQPRVLWFRIPTRLCGLLRAVLCCAVCLLLSCDQLFVTAWAAAHPPGSCLWGFSRQEC